MNRRAFGSWMAFVSVVFAIFAVQRAFAQQTGEPDRDPHAFVRATVRNEIAATSNPRPRWRYRLMKTNASGSRETEIIETHEGLLGRMVSFNGQPLSPEIEENEASRLRELKQDPRQLRAKLARQERDRERVFKMVRALPDALSFVYTGNEKGPYGEQAVFSFRPNPQFEPDSIETEVLHKMSGTLRINLQDRRLVRLEGSLDDDVGIGLGIVGKVGKGGTLLLEQARIAPGSWEITSLDLKVSGRALFRHIDINVSESARDFRGVPPDLSIAQAIDLLLQE